MKLKIILLLQHLKILFLLLQQAPDNDSTYDVVLVVPNIDPIHVATESASNAFEPFSTRTIFFK